MIEPNEASSIGINYSVRPERPGEPFVVTQNPFPVWKRVLDVSLVLLALPVLLFVGLVVAIFIKSVSPGPAFFRQRRVGLFGREFMCLKFRTMKVNADTSVHRNHLKQVMTSNQPTRKLDAGGDDRLIFGGLILRSLGIDELPQFINILRGEMSLVGPRPCIPYEYGLYLPRHKRRCEVPPGLTGLWQVSGKNKTTFEEQIILDVFYVDNKSLRLDLKIIALTIPAVLVQAWEMRIRRRTKAVPGSPGKPVEVPFHED